MASRTLVPYGSHRFIMCYTAIYHILCADVAAYKCRIEGYVVGGVLRLGEDGAVWRSSYLGRRGCQAREGGIATPSGVGLAEEEKIL